jgi:hypothetical protein
MLLPRSVDPKIGIDRGPKKPRARTYSMDHLNAMAKAARVKPEKVLPERNALDAAAACFRIDDRRPTRMAPKQLKDKLERIERTARRLLRYLGVEHTEDADDGPEFDLMVTIATETNDQAKAEASLIDATGRIGRLVQLFEAVNAVAEVETLARNAVDRAPRTAQLTTTQGYCGDFAVNHWISAMLVIYTRITGKRPATSTNPHKDGDPGGPLIRFLTAAGWPLEIDMKPEAWRKRIRRIRVASEK